MFKYFNILLCLLGAWDMKQNYKNVRCIHLKQLQFFFFSPKNFPVEFMKNAPVPPSNSDSLLT